MTSHRYTDGVDVVSIEHTEKSDYLLRDKRKNTRKITSLKGYRRLDDNRSIKEWYQDSKQYAKKHPLAALMSILSVFFGLTQF